jgi:hypothetical protein
MPLARVCSVLAAALMAAGVALTPLAARPLFAAENSDDPTADQAAAQAAVPLSAIGTQLATFNPASIPFSADIDLANPVRGVQAYLTPDTALVDANWPYVDAYSRDNLYWYELEPTEGVFDFSQIDHNLAQAQAHGGKYGFRISAADSASGSHKAPFVPKYLWNRMPGAYTYVSDGATVYMPDFDDPQFLARAKALISAIGARYANDPRLGWVEFGFMGLWGEWHVSNAPKTTRGTLSHLAWTVDSGKQIVDAWRDALPKTRLIAMTLDFDVLDYALGKDPRIGWRHDCLGSQSLDALQQNPGYLNHQDQWKTAPIFWEACGPNTSVALAHDQVIRYHFAAGHTIGGPVQAKVSPADQALMKEYRKLAGYRFAVDSFALPARLLPGQPFETNTTWSNMGLTPAYTPWTVRVQLRNKANAVVWEGTSGLDLQTFLPTRDPNTGSDAAQQWTDTFTLPADAPGGTYDVMLVASDPSGYYKPLTLSNEDQRADGSYLLGSVTIGL